MVRRFHLVDTMDVLYILDILSGIGLVVFFDMGEVGIYIGMEAPLVDSEERGIARILSMDG